MDIQGCCYEGQLCPNVNGNLEIKSGNLLRPSENLKTVIEFVQQKLWNQDGVGGLDIQHNTTVFNSRTCSTA